MLYTVSMRLLLFAFINTKIENNWFSKYLQDTHLLGFRRRLFIQLRSLCFPSDLSPCVGQYGGSSQFARVPLPLAPMDCIYPFRGPQRFRDDVGNNLCWQKAEISQLVASAAQFSISDSNAMANCKQCAQTSSPMREPGGLKCDNHPVIGAIPSAMPSHRGHDHDQVKVPATCAHLEVQ